MTIGDALTLLERGGTLGAALFAIWALVTRRVITRGELDRVIGEHKEDKEEWVALLTDANTELRKQSSTNARLIEMRFSQETTKP